MTLYREAPEVRRIAEQLIFQHHPNLELRADEIRFVFRDDFAKKAGRIVLGSARKIGGLNCYLALADAESPNTFQDHEDVGADMFLIEIAEPAWENLTEAGRQALVDHELCHLDIEYDELTGKTKRKIRGHSVEEFNEIIHRHGLWKPDLAEFAKHIPQPTLPGLTDNEE
jgi:hypothetical protein